ncbi:MAG TPA: hypothetical protein VFM98_21415 [Ramlibacter sp.]|uniref:hypothetical protein n=1 Tax=Ramlibacter sp. TaxID=1917967 RepID=UPI002D7E9392|nr:hypothetical protein [Ramlibacter sp.]HET8748171.1 hypothetical protein [Ramlibacter sp.]
MKMLKSRPVTPTRPQGSRAPAGARTRTLALVTAAPAQEAVPAVPAARAPAAALLRTHSFGLLLMESLLRAARNAGASVALLPQLAQADTGAEALELQAAVVQRLLELQQGWWQAWTIWLEELAQLRRADTLSEHMEQFYNLGAQFGDLLKAQGTDLVDLQDTVQVDYGYWVARKLGTVGV